MKTLGTALLCSLAIGVETDEPKYSRRLQAELDSADSFEAIPTHPRVKLNEYVFEEELFGVNAGNFGVNVNLRADTLLGYSFPAFWVERQGQSWMVFNPDVNGSIEGGFILSFSTPWLVVNANFMSHFFKYTPLELMLSWDLD